MIFSRYTCIYLFKNRSELSQIYRDFTKMIETQFSKPIKVFRSDNAQEYKAHEFTDILHQSGTIPHSSCAGTSQQNGRAERKLRHILDVVRAITLAAATPSSFWGEAALTAVYTINRCPSPIIKNQTPYGLFLVLLPPMIYSEFLDVSVLFFFMSTNETNFSLVLVYVVFLGLVLVKKDIGVTTPLANVFVFLGMWSFGNTKCFTKSLMFLNHLSPLLIQSLIFFLRNPPPPPPYYSYSHPFYF